MPPSCVTERCAGCGSVCTEESCKKCATEQQFTVLIEPVERTQAIAKLVVSVTLVVIAAICFSLTTLNNSIVVLVLLLGGAYWLGREAKELGWPAVRRYVVKGKHCGAVFSVHTNKLVYGYGWREERRPISKLKQLAGASDEQLLEVLGRTLSSPGALSYALPVFMALARAGRGELEVEAIYTVRWQFRGPLVQELVGVKVVGDSAYISSRSELWRSLSPTPGAPQIKEAVEQWINRPQWRDLFEPT